MKSSLTFQILLHLGSYYFGAFAIVEFLLLLFKFIVLPFPRGTLAAEIIILVLLVLIEATRIFTGWKANLTENVGSMGLCSALFIPGILGVLYFLIWQAYILRIELILCAVQLTIQGLQLVFSLICLISFYGGTF